MMDIETQKITQHKPTLNKYSGGNGRVPKFVYYEGVRIELQRSSNDVIDADDLDIELKTKGLLSKLLKNFFD